MIKKVTEIKALLRTLDNKSSPISGDLVCYGLPNYKSSTSAGMSLQHEYSRYFRSQSYYTGILISCNEFFGEVLWTTDNPHIFEKHKNYHVSLFLSSSSSSDTNNSLIIDHVIDNHNRYGINVIHHIDAIRHNLCYSQLRKMIMNIGSVSITVTCLLELIECAYERYDEILLEKLTSYPSHDVASLALARSSDLRHRGRFDYKEISDFSSTYSRTPGSY